MTATMAHLGMGVALEQSSCSLLCGRKQAFSLCAACIVYMVTALPSESCLQPVQAFWVPWLPCAACSLLFLLPAGAALATQPLVACSRAATQQHEGCM